MSYLIKLADVLLKLNNLMGRRTSPQGDSTDLQGYCQDAFNYAWRYYPWSFSLNRATIDLSSDIHVPADFDLDGFFKVAAAVDQPWTYVPFTEYDSVPTGGRYFTLQYDFDTDTYKFLTTFTATSVDIIYQVTPPTLNDDTGKPFPSAMTIGLGAAVYAKQADNPRSADISQEWDEFHAELDRHVARAENNKPAQVVRTRQDKAGTYTGDVGDY